MREAGVPLEYKLWAAVPHDWQLAYTMVPEGRASLNEAAAFLELHAMAASKKTAGA